MPGRHTVMLKQMKKKGGRPSRIEMNRRRQVQIEKMLAERERERQRVKKEPCY